MSAYYVYRRKLRKSKAIERGLKMVPILIHLPPAPSQGASNRDAKEIMREKTAQAEVLYNLLAGTAVTGFRSTFYGQRHVAMELIAIDGVVHFYAAVPVAMASTVEQAIQTAYPGARMEMVEDHNIFNREGRLAATMGGEMVLRTESAYPIATYAKLERDPMEALLTSISALDKQDGVGFQLMLRPAASNWISRSLRVADMKRRGRAAHNDLTVGNLAQAALKAPSVRAEEAKQFNNGQTASQLEQDVATTIEEKTKHPGFEVLIRVVVSTGSVARSQQLLRDIATTFALYDAPGLNGFTFLPAVDVQGLVTAFIFRFFPPELKGSVLNSVELATLFHLPDSQYLPATSIERQKSKQVDGPVKLPAVGLLFGYNEFRGVRKEIRLSSEDRRRHTYILGQTGVGKSTMLENLAVQDMLAGNGFAFIDPHGDSAEKLLALVPKERAEDIIYFDPGDTQYPLGLNLFEFSDPAQKDFLVQETINMLYKLYDPGKTGIIGPRYEHWYRNAALTLMSDPNGSTFIEIPKVFTDTEYLKQKFKYLKDPTVIDFWTKEMGQTSDYHKSEMLGWFVSKFGAFQNNEMMRNIIGQTKSSFNIRDVMDQKKILIVNLSKGRVGELNSQLLGMMFVIKFQAAAMSRANIPEDQRADFCLYVDEFQNFSTDSFSSILSEARKYRLNLIVANQFIGQLQPEIRDAVFGNIGSIVAHRMGPEDAEFMVKQFSPVFDTADLMNLPNYNAAMRLMISGLPSQPFTMVDSPPIGKPNAELGAAVKQLSAAKYGHDKAHVEADIARRLMSGPAPAALSTQAPSVTAASSSVEPALQAVTEPTLPTPPAPVLPAAMDPIPSAAPAPAPVAEVTGPAAPAPASSPVVMGAPPDPKVLGPVSTDPMTLAMETQVATTAAASKGGTMDDSTAPVIPGQRRMTALEAAQARIQAGSVAAGPLVEDTVSNQVPATPVASAAVPIMPPQLAVSPTLANEIVTSVAPAQAGVAAMATMQTQAGALAAAATGGGAGMARQAPPIGAPPVNLDPILQPEPQSQPVEMVAEPAVNAVEAVMPTSAVTPPPVQNPRSDTLSISDIVGSPQDVALLEPGVTPPGGMPAPVMPQQSASTALQPTQEPVPDVSDSLDQVGTGMPLDGDPYANIDILGAAARRPTVAPLPKPVPEVELVADPDETQSPAVVAPAAPIPVVEPAPVAEPVPVAESVAAGGQAVDPTPKPAAVSESDELADTEYIHFVDPAAQQVLARPDIPAPIIEDQPVAQAWEGVAIGPVVTPEPVVEMPVQPIAPTPAPPQPAPVIPQPQPVSTMPPSQLGREMQPSVVSVVPPVVTPVAPMPRQSQIVPTPVSQPALAVSHPVQAPVVALPVAEAAPVPPASAVPVPTVPLQPVVLPPVPELPAVVAQVPLQPTPVAPAVVPPPASAPTPLPQSQLVSVPAPAPLPQPAPAPTPQPQPVPTPVLPPVPQPVANLPVPAGLESVAQMLTESAAAIEHAPQNTPKPQVTAPAPIAKPKAQPVLPAPSPAPVVPKPQSPPVPIPIHTDLAHDVVAAMPALAPSQATRADEQTAQDQLANAQHEIDELLTESLIRLEGRRDRVESSSQEAQAAPAVPKPEQSKPLPTATSSEPVPSSREHKQMVIAPIHKNLDASGSKLDPKIVAEVMQETQVPAVTPAPVIEKSAPVPQAPVKAATPPSPVEPQLPKMPPVPVITKHAPGLLADKPPAPVEPEPDPDLPASESLVANEVAKARAEREAQVKMPHPTSEPPVATQPAPALVVEKASVSKSKESKKPEKIVRPLFRSRAHPKKIITPKGEQVGSAEEAQHNTPSESAQEFGPLTGKVIMPTGEKPVAVVTPQQAPKPANLAPGEVFVDEKGNVTLGE